MWVLISLRTSHKQNKQWNRNLTNQSTLRTCCKQAVHNVINSLFHQEICRSKSQAKRKFKPSIYLVFEFCEHDLAGLLKNPEVKFSAPEKKKIANQLFTGLHYIHKNKVEYWYLFPMLYPEVGRWWVLLQRNLSTNFTSPYHSLNARCHIGR